MGRRIRRLECLGYVRKKKGIPWKEHKQLNDIVVSLESEMGEAKTNGDKQRINTLHLQIVEAGTNLSEFVMENLQ